MKVKKESKEAGLKFNIQKSKVTTSSSISSCQIDGETMETVTDFIFLGCKIITDGDCSHEIKTLAPWKKNCDKPRQHMKKQRHNFANKVHRVKAMVFQVVKNRCESWIIKSKWKELMLSNCGVGEDS